MGPRVGTILASLGIAFAAGAVLLLLRASGMIGGIPRPEFMMGGVVVFLVGIFAFGYGLGKHVTY